MSEGVALVVTVAALVVLGTALVVPRVTLTRGRVAAGAGVAAVWLARTRSAAPGAAHADVRHDHGGDHALGDWLAQHRVTRAGMESTGVYWKPVYYLLEDALEVWLINAEHLHNVPGRKTDVTDSAWIAQMVEHGLVRPSFVPPRRSANCATSFGTAAPWSWNAPEWCSGWRRCSRTRGSS